VLIAAMSRITDVQATVVQKLNQGTIRQRDVILCRAPFLVLFWKSKKEQEESRLQLYLILPFVKAFFSSSFFLDKKRSKKIKAKRMLRRFAVPAPRNHPALFFTSKSLIPLLKSFL
jgi:hypothetical protein